MLGRVVKIEGQLDAAFRFGHDGYFTSNWRIDLLELLRMSERKNRRHPYWAEQERKGDFAWMGENLPILWQAAEQLYVKMGRGLVVVDLTTVILGGHPIFFVPKAEIDKSDQDAVRMVGEYDPDWELVVTLLKEDNRFSTYRVGVPDKKLK